MSVETMLAVVGAVAVAMVGYAMRPIRLTRVEKENRPQERPETWEELDSEERGYLTWWTRR